MKAILLTEKITPMSKRMAKKIVIIAFLLVLLALIGYIMISYYTRNDFVKNCYYSNQQDFDNIAMYFKDLYSEDLRSAKFNGATDELTLSFIITDENNDTSYSSEVRDCSDESFSIALDSLKAQYQENSEHSVFSRICAYYDDGNMLLYVEAQDEAISNTDEMICYYIVYIDEDYDGNHSALGIDKFGVTREPFSGNWCVWSQKDYLY